MSELESILNYLETTSMEPHDDYTSEFSYKEQKVLWKYINQLQQENKKYKEVINKLRELIGKHYFKQSDDYYDYFTEGVCLQDGDYQELEDILKEVE